MLQFSRYFWTLSCSDCS